MRLLYIGDNSDSLNLGCRATSIALRQLAEPHAELLGPVPTRMIAARWPVSDTIGDAAYGRLARLFNRNKFRAIPAIGPLVGSVMDAIGVRDAITHDLDENARVLDRAQAYSSDAAELIRWIAECDGALVNGEGDLIFGTPARQRLLFILTICKLVKARGKRLFYLNAMASPAPGQGPNAQTLAVADEVLASADAFSLRDPVSLEFVKVNLPRAGTKAVMHADAVFAWQDRIGDAMPAEEKSVVDVFLHENGIEDGTPFVLVGGSSRAAWDKPRAAAAYGPLVGALKTLGLPVVIQPACTGDSFLESVAAKTDTPLFPIRAPILSHVDLLSRAALYVSGRWHPSIMASLGGTPSVFLGSNSHKMIALQHQLGYEQPHEYNPYPEPADIDAILSEARTLLGEGQDRRDFIRTRASQLAHDASEVVAPLRMTD